MFQKQFLKQCACRKYVGGRGVPTNEQVARTLVACNAVTCDMGGAVKVTYVCSGCKTSSRRNHIKLGSSGGIHTGRMYVCNKSQGPPASSGYLASQCPHIHGTLHPIVKQMVDEMCEREKRRMRRMGPSTLGSCQPSHPLVRCRLFLK